LYKLLDVIKKDRVTFVYLNNPKTLNALDLEIRIELINLFDELENDEETKVIVLAGRGKAFCAGGDLGTMKDFKPNVGRKRLQYIHRLVKKIMSIEKPVIAAVHGYAYGGGWNMALSCDLVVAARGTRFCQSYAKVGLLPDLGGLFILPRIVGLQKAKELMLTANTVSAEEAYAMGLVNYLVESEELITKATEIANKLAAGPHISLGITKVLLNRSMELDLAELLDYESFGQDLCMMSEDFAEGRDAFLEKRMPQFKGK
jgi:2-(1,2-epoxy-1,2-dihydrophenyl)acetyl-CoA isomerase